MEEKSREILLFGFFVSDHVLTFRFNLLHIEKRE